MTNFAQITPEAISGKHNMASDAFQALRTARANGQPNKDQFSFADVLDTINPLQHIPLVSSAYRELTGDEISPQARMAGGALYGGPIGFVASMIDSAIDLATGDDIGGHILAGLFGSSSDAKTEKVASTTPPAEMAPLVTGSIVPKAKPVATPASTPAKSAKPAQAMPQLSPEAFDALLNSFSDPKAAKTANADMAKQMAAEATASDPTKPAPVAPPAMAVASMASPAGQPDNNPTNIMRNMQSGLDQLDALKAANAKSLALNAMPASSMQPDF